MTELYIRITNSMKIGLSSVGPSMWYPPPPPPPEFCKALFFCLCIALLFRIFGLVGIHELRAAEFFPGVGCS